MCFRGIKKNGSKFQVMMKLWVNSTKETKKTEKMHAKR